MKKGQSRPRPHQLGDISPWERRHLRELARRKRIREQVASHEPFEAPMPWSRADETEQSLFDAVMEHRREGEQEGFWGEFQASNPCPTQEPT